MISKQEVKKIADLARLRLSEAETSKMQKDLSEILGYIGLLNQADVSGVEPFKKNLSEENILKKDEPCPASEETRQSIVSQFSQKQGDYLKVKKILN